MPKAKDLVGQTFGRLVVLAKRPNRYIYWQCRCECGRVVTVNGESLRAGETQSCGCLRRENIARWNFKHGMSGTREYVAWISAKDRCYNQNHKDYPDYGGRGITMCDEWRRDFAAFFAAVGKKPTRAHTLDRIDVNGHYEPGNVRWATPTEQANNKRRHHRLSNGETLAQASHASGDTTRRVRNRLRLGWTEREAIETPRMRPPTLLTYKGRTRRAVEWARAFNLNYQTLRKRLRLGWSIHKALTTPVG